MPCSQTQQYNTMRPPQQVDNHINAETSTSSAEIKTAKVIWRALMVAGGAEKQTLKSNDKVEAITENMEQMECRANVKV